MVKRMGLKRKEKEVSTIEEVIEKESKPIVVLGKAEYYKELFQVRGGK